LLPQRSKHPREMVITPKASTSNYMYPLQGVTAASSGTQTCWCRKQASSLALSGAPVAAGQRSYRRGAAEIPAGSP